MEHKVDYSLLTIGKQAKKASREMQRLGVLKKNEGLEAVATALVENYEKLLTANQEDVTRARENGMKESPETITEYFYLAV